MAKLFGTDGIRGIANTFPMDPETASNVGWAVARYFKANRAKGHVVIGQDTRLSGSMLALAVGAGVCSAGADVIHLGVLPTPAVAHLTVATGAIAGIVISASHNPYEDNGIKVFRADGTKLSDDAEERIESLLIDNQPRTKANPDQIGSLRANPNVSEQYLSFLQQAVPRLSLKGLIVALDCANGATYEIAPRLFQRLGADVISLFCSPNGININEKCGSQYPESLAQTVLERGAHIGLAFDGDGDRLIAVDETGRILRGDQIIAICASHLQRSGHLRNNTVVSTVMSNMGLGKTLKKMGIRLVTCQVGDRYVMEKMQVEDAVLGGEDSGHLIFRDVHTTGDGLMAGVKLLDAMHSLQAPLSELSKIMTVFPQELINVAVKEKPDLKTVPEIINIIDDAETALGDQGRVLVRYSGTQDLCRIMVEGPTKELTLSYCRNIAAVIKQVLS